MSFDPFIPIIPARKPFGAVARAAYHISEAIFAFDCLMENHVSFDTSLGLIGLCGSDIVSHS